MSFFTCIICVVFVCFERTSDLRVALLIILFSLITKKRYLHSQVPAEDASRNIRYEPDYKKSNEKTIKVTIHPHISAMWWHFLLTWGKQERSLQAPRSTLDHWELNLRHPSSLWDCFFFSFLLLQLLLPSCNKCPPTLIWELDEESVPHYPTKEACHH